MLAEGASDLGSEESSGEYETDSDEDARQLLKPTFTQKQDRETIAERDRAAEVHSAALLRDLLLYQGPLPETLTAGCAAQEEERAAAERAKQLEARKGETRSLVIERIRVSCLCLLTPIAAACTAGLQA